MQDELDAVNARRRRHKFKIVIEHNVTGVKISNVDRATLGFTITTAVRDVSFSPGALIYEAVLNCNGTYTVAGGAHFEEDDEVVTVTKTATRATLDAIRKQARATHLEEVFDGTFLDGETVLDSLFQVE